MRILYLDWPCFGKNDTLNAFEQLGHTYDLFFHKDYEKRTSQDFDDVFASFVGDTQYDICFSFNYFTVLSENCKKYQMKYVSVVYDSPYVMLYSYTLINPTNYVFLFDKQEYLKLRSGGINTVYYCPLPVNARRLEQLIQKPFDHKRLSAEVSFVGALYNEEHNLFELLTKTQDYTNGYLHAIMEAQLKVQGYNFIEELLTPDILKDLQKAVPYDNSTQGIETPAYIYANYFINRKITATERQRLLTRIAKHYALRLYTLDPKANIPNAQNMGHVDYYNEMPFVFANSKINLNISLRSIQSGIPLRAMDIMGAGGFLLTNFQADFLDYFIPGEDFVYYESEEDLLNKIEYYLSHESERKEIAHNGHEKVKQNHSFELFFTEVFHIVTQS